MLIGISLLTLAISNGEIFDWQIPLACLFIISGVVLEPHNR